MSDQEVAVDVVQERAKRLQELCRGAAVRRSFPLLVELALPDDLLSMLRHLTTLYIRASLKCFRPDKSFSIGPHLLEEYGEDIVRLPNRTPNGKLAAKKEIALEFNLVEQCVELLFKQLGISEHVDLIQLPVIVRIQDGRPDPVVENRPYATSKIHSDIWTGEAADSATVIIPVLGDIEHTGVDCYEPDIARAEDFARTFDDYVDTQSLIKLRKQYDCAMNKSSLYILDSFCLHQTVKQNGGIRVSIDFRFLFKNKVPSDVQRDARRLTHFVPQQDWYTLDRNTFLQPTGTFEEAVRKFVGAPVSRGGVNEKEFSIVPRESLA